MGKAAALPGWVLPSCCQPQDHVAWASPRKLDSLESFGSKALCSPIARTHHFVCFSFNQPAYGARAAEEKKLPASKTSVLVNKLMEGSTSEQSKQGKEKRSHQWVRSYPLALSLVTMLSQCGGVVPIAAVASIWRKQQMGMSFCELELVFLQLGLSWATQSIPAV